MRYRHTDKGRATSRRYWQTAKGRATRMRFNPKRLWIGDRYVGTASSADQAAAINTHTKGLMDVFEQRQSADSEI